MKKSIDLTGCNNEKLHIGLSGFDFSRKITGKYGIIRRCFSFPSLIFLRMGYSGKSDDDKGQEQIRHIENYFKLFFNFNFNKIKDFIRIFAAKDRYREPARHSVPEKENVYRAYDQVMILNPDKSFHQTLPLVTGQAINIALSSASDMRTINIFSDKQFSGDNTFKGNINETVSYSYRSLGKDFVYKVENYQKQPANVFSKESKNTNSNQERVPILQEPGIFLHSHIMNFTKIYDKNILLPVMMSMKNNLLSMGIFDPVLSKDHHHGKIIIPKANSSIKHLSPEINKKNDAVHDSIHLPGKELIHASDTKLRTERSRDISYEPINPVKGPEMQFAKDKERSDNSSAQNFSNSVERNIVNDGVHKSFHSIRKELIHTSDTGNRPRKSRDLTDEVINNVQVADMKFADQMKKFNNSMPVNISNSIFSKNLHPGMINFSKIDSSVTDLVPQSNITIHNPVILSNNIPGNTKKSISSYQNVPKNLDLSANDTAYYGPRIPQKDLIYTSINDMINPLSANQTREMNDLQVADMQFANYPGKLNRSGISSTLSGNILTNPPEMVLRNPIVQKTENKSEIKNIKKEGSEYKPVKTDSTKIRDIEDYVKARPVKEINDIADKVYRLIEKKITIEKDRRGLF